MLNDTWDATDTRTAAVLAEHGGVAKLATFLAAGLAPKQIAAQAGRGVVERPRIGWYVDPALPWQAKCAIRVGGVLGCVSALDSFGLPVPQESRRQLHVVVPSNAPRRRHSRDRRWYVSPGQDAAVHVHWSRSSGQPPGWRTSLVAALLLAVDCLPADWWIAAVDAAVHRSRESPPLLDDQDLERLRTGLPQRARGLLDQVDPLSESCIETLLRLGMIRRAIGPLVLQFAPTGHHRVDFLLPRKLIIEADGEAFHDAEADERRDAMLRRLGYRVLRFSYARIVGDLEAVLDEIEAALVTP